MNKIYLVAVSVLISLNALNALAEQKVNMNFLNEELVNVIATYSKAANQKFIVDPSVRGKITILLPEAVTIEEAFNHLSSALAINGYAISKQGDTMVIKSARNIQRDFIEVSTTLPSIKPERMFTWIYSGKHQPVESIMRELRILSSKDGEITANSRTNQLIISDFTANINRVAAILEEIDKPVSAATAKLVESSRREREKSKLQEAALAPRLPPSVTAPKGESPKSDKE